MNGSKNIQYFISIDSKTKAYCEKQERKEKDNLS